MMGFNIHPVQQVQQSCAQDSTLSLPVTLTALPTLESTDKSLVQVFSTACTMTKETTIKKETTHADF
jgi:hypothetical protein